MMDMETTAILFDVFFIFHAYANTYNVMARKVNKTLSLPLDVVERLEDEENQSKTVEKLLREEYDL